MEEALSVFEQAYQADDTIEVGITALKAQGFSQLDTIIVLIQSLAITAVEANELVAHSLAWSP